MTPRQVAYLHAAANEREKELFLAYWRGPALVAAETRNTLRSKPAQRVWKMQDFMPQEPKRLNADEQLSRFRAWAAAINGGTRGKS